MPASGIQAWYAEFLLEMDLKILLGKTGARLNFKIAIISMHFDLDPHCISILSHANTTLKSGDLNYGHPNTRTI
jgi:hypothetical protein